MAHAPKGPSNFHMTSLSLPLPRYRKPILLLLAGAVMVLIALAVRAQVSGDRGIAPVAVSRDIQVSGIKVDTTGKTGEAAREEGWKQAERLAWAKLGGPKLSDSQISSMVSAIVIEHEQLGLHRYIAQLGVTFDRGRANQYLGGGGAIVRSSPMLLIPVTVSAGTDLVYQRRNQWQRAWADFQAGNSNIDYVRPVGAGGDSLMVTFGQTDRRSRLWWRAVLDQFGASDVLVAIAKLDYSYPGGPIAGHFIARYGPDDKVLASFDLKARGPDQLDAMLDSAVQRFDGIFTDAFNAGKLRPDPTLNVEAPALPPAIAALVQRGRELEAQDAAAAAAAADANAVGVPLPDGSATSAPAASATDTPPTPAPVVKVTSYTVQFATPNAASVDSALAAARGASGVRAATTSSLAIGGVSVMRITYSGSQAELAKALRARGFTVREGAGGLSVSR